MIELTGRKGDVAHLAFSPDGRVVAASGGGRQLELWDVATANLWGRHTGMGFGDGPVHFHPTKPLCFASYLHGVPEIDTATKKARMLLVQDKGINVFWTAALLADGSGFVCHCNGNFHARGVLWRLKWSAKKMLTVVWTAPLGATPNRTRRGHQPRLMRAAPDGKVFVSLDANEGEGPWSPGEATRLAVRSVADGKLVAAAPLPPHTSLALAVAPDSKSFVTCQGNALSVWNAADLAAKPRVVRSDNKAHLTAVAYHPSGRYLAATSNDATVRLFDTATWTVAKSFTWNIGRMRSVAFSPDGTLAAAGSDAGKVVVWDVDV